MANLALIFVCLAAGILLRKSGRFGESAPSALNVFVTYISLPALVLALVPPLVRTASLDRSVLVPISMPWITFVLAFLGVGALGRWFGWSRATTGALVLTVGLGNTAFVGYPLIEALLGTDAVRFAVLVDQPGSFVVLSTLGIAAASYFAGEGARASTADEQGRGRGVLVMLRRLVTFPPFVALLLAALWGASGMHRSGTAFGAMLDKLAATLVPVALVAVGSQLRVDAALIRQRWKPLVLGLVLKLFVEPAFFLVLYVFVLSMKGLPVRVTVLQAAMASMVTSAVLVAELGLDIELASLMLGVGIPLSLLTVPLWNLVLTSIL